MKRIIFTLLILAFAFSSVFAQQTFTVDNLMQTRRVGDPQLSPDGKTVAYTIGDVNVQANKTLTQIYMVPTNGGEVKQFTKGDKSNSSPRWSPDGKKIAYTTGGQIWVIDSDGNINKQLTKISTGAANPVWSPDGKWIAFISDVYPECNGKDDCNKAEDDKVDNSKVQAKVTERLLYRHWTEWRDRKRTHVFIVSSDGAIAAARLGAVGVLVRSAGASQNRVVHTGAMRYADGVTKIPAAATSFEDAETIAYLAKMGKVRIKLLLTPQTLPDAPSFNVIGEIKGSEFPNEVIVIGGHLDSWDVAQGAHDDGAGSVQSMDILNLMKQSGYKPKRTIRCVLFMNEENGLRGGTKYAEEAAKSSEKHILALESDAGGFTPRGISFEADPSVFVEKFKKIGAWEDLLKPYGIELTKGGSGADIGPLKPMKFMLGGLRPDSQRYFDFHHTEFDKIEYVNRRELELGSAAMAALVFLVDKYGL